MRTDCPTRRRRTAALLLAAAVPLALLVTAGPAQNPVPRLPIYDPRFTNEEVSYSLVDGRVTVDGDLSLGTEADVLRRSWRLAVRTALAAMAVNDRGKRPVDDLKLDPAPTRQIEDFARMDPDSFPTDNLAAARDRVRFANEVLRPLRNKRKPDAAKGDREQARVIFAGASREFVWPGGRIPYFLDPGLPQNVRELVARALAHWTERTTVGGKPHLKFDELQAEPDPKTDHVQFVPGSGPGSDWYGKLGGRQNVYLSAPPACEVQQVIHEIGHVVGLLHEHSRSDRDQFLRVVRANVGMFAAQFDQPPVRADDAGEFDWQSIMLYPPRAFSRPGAPTLVKLVPPKDDQWGIASGPLQGGVTTGLSKGDVAATLVLYPEPCQ
jgi:hypothetical protein